MHKGCVPHKGPSSPNTLRNKAWAHRLMGVGQAVALMLVAGCPSVEPMLRMHGYMPLKPPSTLFAPGTLVWVKSDRPFAAGVICTQDMSLGENFQPMVSRTASGDATRVTDQEVGIAADAWNAIQADARFNEISGIALKLDNPVIYELNDVDVIRFATKRSSACSRAVAMRAKAGYKVTMISSALRADATYTVTWRRDISVGADDRTGILKNLAIELGAERSQIDDYTIAAKDLYWGIKDDQYLAHLSDPGVLQDSLPKERAMGAGLEPSLSRSADVYGTRPGWR